MFKLFSFVQKLKKYVMNQSSYKDALTSAMTELGKLDNTIFIGQQLLL